jgi:hypothetical protein
MLYLEKGHLPMWMLLAIAAGAVFAGFALFAAWGETSSRKQFEATLSSEQFDRLRAFLHAGGSWNEFAELKEADRGNDAQELIQARLSLAADWLPLSIPDR